MRKLLISTLIAVTALASCTRPVTHGRDTIPLVKEIAAESTGAEHKLLASFSKVPSSGDIYIIGSSEACALAGRAFRRSDVFENARGSLKPDGLRDFAGENFACICDSYFAPYGDYYASNGSEELRETAVRLALAALAPRCNVSIFDLDGNMEKTPAKMIVLADPWLTEYGKFDIDTLFSLTSCRVPVISPQDLMFDAVFAGEKKHFNIGILSDSLYVGKGIYPALFESKTRQHDILGARFFEAATRSDEGVLINFLKDYAEAGHTEPITALLIDDWSVSPRAIQRELNAIRDFSREESMHYGKLIAPDFTVFSSSSLTMKACYGLLRSGSLFTHRIAQPQVRDFVVKPRPDNKDLQFLLIPSENVQD